MAEWDDREPGRVLLRKLDRIERELDSIANKVEIIHAVMCIGACMAVGLGVGHELAYEYGFGKGLVSGAGFLAAFSATWWLIRRRFRV